MSDAHPPPAKIRIFISHCATGVEADETVLKWLLQELSRYSHVQVDRRFGQESETDWRENIRRYIRECDIAISLYGERALNTNNGERFRQSVFIHEEAAALDLRKSSFPDLPWLIFRQKSITPTAMQSATQGRLADIPAHKWIEDEDELLLRLKELIRQQTTQFVHQPELKYFAERIKAALHQKDCSSLSEWLKVRPGAASHTSLITMLTEKLLRQGCDCLSQVNQPSLGIYLGPELRRSLLTDLAPLWIPYERAEHLQKGSAHTLGSGVKYELASKFTAHWHVKRAWPEKDCNPITIPSMLNETKLLTDIRAELFRRVSVDEEPDSFLEDLKRYQSSNGPISVILPPLIGISDDFFETLKDEFPGVICLHLIQHQKFSIDKLPTTAPLLSPTLNFEREKTAIEIVRQPPSSSASHEVSP